ncbi:MAG TPA: hypothetical protein VHM31_09130, partial [Polyangia bacterium]|nr:hypothetical protein [Polyangia bacterium]
MFAGRSQRVDHERIDDAPPPDGPLARRLGRIRRRLTLLAAVDGAVTGAAIAATAGALLVAWWRWRGGGHSAGARAGAVAALVAVG